MLVAPTAISLFYAFTRWTLFEWEWISLDNFRQFFREPALTNGLRNTIVYAVVTSGLKVTIGMGLAVLCTSPKLHVKGAVRSIIFFPVLVSTVAVGITFERLMHPSSGMINQGLGFFGVDGPKWLTDPSIALLSVAFVDVWQGVGLALVILIAGILVTSSVIICNDFQNPLYFLPGQDNTTVQLTLYNFQGQFNTQWNLLFMDVLLITIPPLVMFMFFNRKIVAGLTAGAIKR